MASENKNFGPVATPEGRLSWPSLSEPNTKGKFPDGKYGASILIPKSVSIDVLKDACFQAAKLTWPGLLNSVAGIGKLKLPFKDGDAKAEQEGYAEHVYLTCKSKSKPVIVDAARRDYLGALKGGDYVRFSVTAGAFRLNLDAEAAAAFRSAGKTVMEGVDKDQKRYLYRPAVTFYLNSVQFLREGAALGGGGSGVKAFEDAPVADHGGDDLFR